TDMVEKD
ncbi:hypothetical protein SLEP1_g60256, partial [Rubroshorea leprosula]